MKLKSLTSLTLGFFLTACGSEIVDQLQSQNGIDEDVQFLLADNEESGLVDESDAALEEDSGALDGSDESVEMKKLIQSLHVIARKQVAECAGISEEAQALYAAKKQAREAGLSQEEVKAAVQAERKSLMSALKGKKEEVIQCRESVKQSPEAHALRALMKGCWEVSRKDSVQLREDAASKERTPRRMLPQYGKKARFFEFNPVFTSEACSIAVEDAESLLQ